MIDKSHINFFMQQRTHGYALAGSGVLFVALPLASLLCYLAGWIAYAACHFAIWTTMLVATVGICVGGLALLIGAIGKQGEAAGGGFAGLVVGGLSSLAYDAIKDSWAKAAANALAACRQKSAWLFEDLFVGDHFWLISWSVLALSLLLGFVVVLTIEFLVGLNVVSSIFNHMTFRCPNLNCKQDRKKKGPFVQCSNTACGAVIKDLSPSKHGVFFAACDQCKQQLPTNRFRLKKVCRACDLDMNVAGLGECAEFLIPVVAAASAGKSMWLTGAVDDAQSHQSDAQLDVAEPTRKKEFEQAVSYLKRGSLLSKTARYTCPAAMPILVGDPASPNGLAYMYDSDGGAFTDTERLKEYTFNKSLSGMVVIIDPFAEPGLLALSTVNDPGQLETAGLNPAHDGVQLVLENQLKSLETHGNLAPGQQLNIPVAVVVTKIDAGGLANELENELDGGLPCRMPLAEQLGKQDYYSERIRSWLSDCGLQATVNLLESRFSEVSYFASSVVTIDPDQDTGIAYNPQAAGPLLWLFERLHLVHPKPTPLRWLSNGFGFARRSLQGRGLLIGQITVCVITIAAVVGLAVR